VLSVLPALAVRPDEVLADKALEARARASRRACAASLARTSRSKIPTPISPGIFASSCASG